MYGYCCCRSIEHRPVSKTRLTRTRNDRLTKGRLSLSFVGEEKRWIYRTRGPLCTDLPRRSGTIRRLVHVWFWLFTRPYLRFPLPEPLTFILLSVVFFVLRPSESYCASRSRPFVHESFGGNSEGKTKTRAALNTFCKTRDNSRVTIVVSVNCSASVYKMKK